MAADTYRVIVLLLVASLPPQCTGDPTPSTPDTLKADGMQWADVQVDVALADLPKPADTQPPEDVEDIWKPTDSASGVDTVPQKDSTDAGDTEVLADIAEADTPSEVEDTTSVPDEGGAPDTSPEDIGPGGDPPGTWRSVLFPKDWTPDYTIPGDLYVHDFSYAGYHNSEEGLPASDGLQEFLITDYGAIASEVEDSTAAIQAAIEAASVAGGIVLVPAGTYRCDGLLTIGSSNVVLRGVGSQESRLFFTLSENMTGKSHITIAGAVKSLGNTPLAVDGESRSKLLSVADSAGLEVGDDIAIGWTITEDFIDSHGMTGTWKAFNGQWEPFFRREIVAIDKTVSPQQITLDVPLRYDALVSDGASIRKETGYLSEVGVEELGLSNSVSFEAAWSNLRVHVLDLKGVKDGWIRNVASFPSPAAPTSGNGKDAHLQNGGIIVRASKRVTVADSFMGEAQNRGSGGCGYLFEVRTSSEILFRDCSASEGRHNFIQNWGFGLTGTVWLRCLSEDGFAVILDEFPAIGKTGYSEFHHSLATANLIDSSVLHDGWKAVNRKNYSTGAGHTSTETVFWNNKGKGKIYSRQYGKGYVVGTGKDLDTVYSLSNGEADGTAPKDHVEGLGEGETLWPQSLFEAQLELRLKD